MNPRSQGQKSNALIIWPRAYSRSADLSKYRGNRWSNLRTRWKGGVSSLYSKPWLSTKRKFGSVHLLLICVHFWDEALLLLCSDSFRPIISTFVQCIREMFLWIYSLLKSLILKTWKSSSFIWGTFLFCLAYTAIKWEESTKNQMFMNLRNMFVWVYCILVGFLPWEAPTDFIISRYTFNQ